MRRLNRAGPVEQINQEDAVITPAGETATVDIEMQSLATGFVTIESSGGSLKVLRSPFTKLNATKRTWVWRSPLSPCLDLNLIEPTPAAACVGSRIITS